MFLVGDPMQSIYRFRESQVGIFINAVRNGISNLKIKSLILNTNFRSNESIVQKNNENFSKIFPDNDDLLKGAIQYSHSNSFSRIEQKEAVSFYPFYSPFFSFEQIALKAGLFPAQSGPNPGQCAYGESR